MIKLCVGGEKGGLSLSRGEGGWQVARWKKKAAITFNLERKSSLKPWQSLKVYKMTCLHIQLSFVFTIMNL